MDRAAVSALDALHRRCDGPPPAWERRAVRLGGMARANALRCAAVLALHERLAAEARLAAARRRTALSGQNSGDDVWLARLAATLAHHRHAAVALAVALAAADQRNAYSQ